MASLGFQNFLGSWNHQSHSNQVILGEPSGTLDLTFMKNSFKFSMEDPLPVVVI